MKLFENTICFVYLHFTVETAYIVYYTYQYTVCFRDLAKLDLLMVVRF